MGKGSKRRSEDRAAYESNFERTFVKKEPQSIEPKSVPYCPEPCDICDRARKNGVPASSL